MLLVFGICRSSHQSFNMDPSRWNYVFCTAQSASFKYKVTDSPSDQALSLSFASSLSLSRFRG